MTRRDAAASAEARRPEGDCMRLHRGVTTTLLTLTFAMASALPAVAQKKATVGGRPSPGQTVRLSIVQDADLNMKPAEATAGSPMGPMHLKAKTTTTVVQSVGAPDEKGVLQVDMTYEDIKQDVTVNDQPAPPEAAQEAAKIKGKTLSMTIDANGEVIEVTPPPGFPMPAAMMKDMLKQALGLMVRQELTVGEPVSAPFAMAMPIPIPGDPPQLKGEMKSTLTGVTGPAGGEIAALEQVVTAGVDSTMAGPGGSGDITIKMQVTGRGTSDWDVKGGLVKASKMTTNISGTFTIPGVGAMALTGTTTVSLDRVP
jgi:hypothetical protein